VTFPTCHDGVRDLLLCRYVKLRLHAHAASLSRGAAKHQFTGKLTLCCPSAQLYLHYSQ